MMTRAKSRIAVQSLLCLASTFLAQSASALTLVLPADKTPSATSPTCKSFDGKKNYVDCKSQTFIAADAATITTTYMKEKFNGKAPTTETFKTAFDNWNAAQTTGVIWTLVNGGALEKLTVTVDPFKPFADNLVGGIENVTAKISFDTGYMGPTIDQLVWSQGLYINFQPPKTPLLDPPAVTMDSYKFNGDGSGDDAFGKAAEPLPKPPASSNNVLVDISASPADTAYADPIYPFQYADKHYFDAPKGPWVTGSFRAIALLSTVKMTTDNTGKVTAATLTVYDGFSYGFDLSGKEVPEPATWAMLVIGFGAMGAAMRRRTIGVRFAAC